MDNKEEEKKDERQFLELSPKYKENISDAICSICGKELNIKLIVGRIRRKNKQGVLIENSDLKAPERMTYGLCDKCKKLIESGYVIFHETDSNDKYTGNFAFVKIDKKKFGLEEETFRVKCYEDVFKKITSIKPKSKKIKR